MAGDGVATLIQAIATLVALAGVSATVLLTRRGQRQDAEKAASDARHAERSQRASEAAAERAERASALTIDALTRIADSVESLAARERDPNTLLAAALQPRVRWSLKHFQGDRYILENIGDAIAHGVTVSAHESMIGPEAVEGGPDLLPDEVMTFIALRTMGTTDSTITVRWTGDPADGAESEWRYPLPPSPPRS
jgi:hypothetical protein